MRLPGPVVCPSQGHAWLPEPSDPGRYLIIEPEVEVAEFTTKRKLAGLLQPQDMLRRIRYAEPSLELVEGHQSHCTHSKEEHGHAGSRQATRIEQTRKSSP